MTPPSDTPPADPAVVEKLHAKARQLAKEKRLDEAATAYLEVVQLAPGNIKAWLTLAVIEGKRGHRESCAKIFKRLGRHYEELGETAKAVAVYEQALFPDAPDAKVHRKLAALHLSANRGVESWNHYRAALAQLLKDKRFGDAVDVLEAMTDLQTENVVLWLRLGETAVSAGMNERAVPAFKKAMSLLRQRDRIEPFLRVGERLLGLTPGDLSLAWELGATYLEQDEVPLALGKLRRCYEANPADVETLSLLVEAFLRIDAKDKAVNALRLLADLHLQRGEEAQADLTRKRMLELDPDSAAEAPLPAPSEPAAVPWPAAEPVQPSSEPTGAAPPPDHSDKVAKLLLEATGYAKVGLHDGAADALRQARALAPTDEQVYLLLKAAYRELDAQDELVALIVDHGERLVHTDRERAAALLEEAQDLDPDHPAVFRARIGPLDPTGEVEPDDEGSEVRMVAEPRWADERSSMKLLSDITEVTVKKVLQPEATSRINLDSMEKSLITQVRAVEQERRRTGPNPFDDIRTMDPQPSGPKEIQTFATGEIDLSELRQVLQVDPDSEEDG